MIHQALSVKHEQQDRALRIIAFKLQIVERFAGLTIPANSVQTVRVQL